MRLLLAASHVLPRKSKRDDMSLDAKTAAGARLHRGRTDNYLMADALAGFAIRMGAGGHRSWLVQFRVNGRTRRVSLGAVSKLPANQARDAARKLLAQVELGGDPQGEREEKRRLAVGTFRSVVDAYLIAREPE